MALAGDELLPAIDVVGRAREGLIDHDVDGERSDVGWTDDPPDGKSGAEPFAAASISSPRSAADNGVSTKPAVGC